MGSTQGFSPEKAANFSGGGFSGLFATPSWQSASVASFLKTVPAGFTAGFNRGGRGYPDVSLQGWNFQFVSGGAPGLVGGTSASTPTFASIISLINDRLIAAGKPVLGFLNPFLYSTASSFTDITTGRNSGNTCPTSAVRLRSFHGIGLLIDFQPAGVRCGGGVGCSQYVVVSLFFCIGLTLAFQLDSEHLYFPNSSPPRWLEKSNPILDIWGK